MSCVRGGVELELLSIPLACPRTFFGCSQSLFWMMCLVLPQGELEVDRGGRLATSSQLNMVQVHLESPRRSGTSPSKMGFYLVSHSNIRLLHPKPRPGSAFCPQYSLHPQNMPYGNFTVPNVYMLPPPPLFNQGTFNFPPHSTPYDPRMFQQIMQHWQHVPSDLFLFLDVEEQSWLGQGQGQSNVRLDWPVLSECLFHGILVPSVMYLSYFILRPGISLDPLHHQTWTTPGLSSFSGMVQR